MAAKFVYRGRERRSEDVTRRATQAGSIYDSYLVPDARLLKVPAGENCIRILPASWTSDEDFDKWGNSWEIQVWLHYGVGPDEAAYLCLDKMKGERCPVCEARQDAADAEESDQLKPSFRALCYAVDRNNEKAGPQVWSMPATLFREINARSTDKKTGAVILIDGAGTDEKTNEAIEGYDILFTREGTDIKTKYTAVEISRDSSPLNDDVDIENAWLEYITEHPLPEMLQFYGADYIEKVLGGQSNRRRGGEDDNVNRGRGRGGRDRGSEAPARARRTARDEVPEESVDQTEPSRSAPADAPFEGGRRRRGPSEDWEKSGDPLPGDETPARGRRPVRGEGGESDQPAARGRQRGSTEEPAEADAPPPARQARASLSRMRERRGG